MLSRHQREIRRLVVFGMVGSLNTAICYGLFAALVHWLAWNYNMALVADYAFGAVLGYSLHRIATFADRKNVRLGFGKYAVTLIIAFLLNIAVLNLIVQRLQLDPLPAQAMSIMLVTLLSYTMQRFWVFRSHHHPQAVPEAETEPAAQAPLAV